MVKQQIKCECASVLLNSQFVEFFEEIYSNEILEGKYMENQFDLSIEIVNICRASYGNYFPFHTQSNMVKCARRRTTKESS